MSAELGNNPEQALARFSRRRFGFSVLAVLATLDRVGALLDEHGNQLTEVHDEVADLHHEISQLDSEGDAARWSPDNIT